MNLTNDETKLIEQIRKIREHAGMEEVCVLLRYIPLGEADHVQQILRGETTSILGIRLQMKKLLDDLVQINQPSSFFSITYEPGLLRIFEH